MNEHLPSRSCDCPECRMHFDSAEPYFLQRLRVWLTTCFGVTVAKNKTTRNHRFFEEACELVQACDMTRYEAHALVDAIWDRPKGEKHQEVGGVGTTLGALCLAHEIPMFTCFDRELESVWGRIPKIQARQKTKLRPEPGDPPRGAFLLIDYTNWKGERRKRVIVPRYLRFGTSPQHDQIPQWLLEAVDIEKGPRTFALTCIHSAVSWTQS